MSTELPDTDRDPFQDVFNDLESLPGARPDLAESIFAQTRGVQSRRRWLRRGRVALAFLACYAAGLGSGWLLKPSAAPHLAGQTAPSVVAQEDPSASPNAPVSRVNPPSNGQVQAKPAVAASDLASSGLPPQTAVAVVKSSQFDSFRRAGDRQLLELGNLRLAMDCYRRALTHATEQELRVEIDRDTWLLMSLKQSRLEERKHVRQKRV